MKVEEILEKELKKRGACALGAIGLLSGGLFTAALGAAGGHIGSGVLSDRMATRAVTEEFTYHGELTKAITESVRVLSRIGHICEKPDGLSEPSVCAVISKGIEYVNPAVVCVEFKPSGADVILHVMAVMKDIPYSDSAKEAVDYLRCQIQINV